MFDIKNKVALITGGASGIGLQYAKELLRNGLRGVTLADVNPDFGQKAIIEITNEFGPDKAIFIQTDVTNYENFKEAFQKTIETFKNLDILINNAGILDDSVWEKEITINVNGVVNGMLLGLENYVTKYKTGDEGVIVNISSIAGVKESAAVPIYTGTKFAVHGMSLAWGAKEHYERTKVKVIALCPGVTFTPLITEIAGKTLSPPYEQIHEDIIPKMKHLTQPPESVSKAMVKIVKEAKSGTVWVAECSKEPYQFVLPNITSLATVCS